MTLTQFRKKFSGAPLDTVELAHLILDELDSSEADARALCIEANKYLIASSSFIAALTEANVELG